MANTSLGTAWIQIKPSMKGMTSSIRKDLAGVETEANRAVENISKKTGSIFDGLSSNFKKTFSSAFKNIGNETVSIFTSAFQKVNSAAKTFLLAGVTTAVGVLSSSISSAVARIDTLNNAPRVFDAMGYSTESVNQAMETLNTYLDGLPTTLDSAVSGVQILSASFDGIENGTKYFQAVNDAGLAFGASTEMIENAIFQLSQTDLDGPLDAATWNSLRNSGFSPVFAAMAEEAGVTVGELKESFGGNGTKTVREFLDALVKMDTEGSGSMKSLSEMARANTDGIATSFKNAKTAITRGVAESIKTIPNLTSSVLLAGKSIEKVLKGTMGVDEASKNIQKFAQNMMTGIHNIAEKIIPLVLSTLPKLAKNVIDSLATFLLNNDNLMTLVNGFVDLFKTIAASASIFARTLLPMLPEVIKTVIRGITGVLPSIVDTLVEVIGTIADTIVELLGDQETTHKFIEGFVKIFAAVAKASVQIADALIPLIPDIIGTVVDELKKDGNVGVLANGIGILFGAAFAKNSFSKATNWLGDMPEKLAKSFTSKMGSKLKSGVSTMFSKVFKKSTENVEIILPGAEKKTKSGSLLEDAIAEMSGGNGAVTKAKTFGEKISGAFRTLKDSLVSIFDGIRDVLTSAAEAIVTPLKTLLKGVGEAIAGFFGAFANGQVAMGAAIFALAAASIAASIFLIGSAIGAVMPTLQALFDGIIMPTAIFIRDTVLLLIDSLVVGLTNLTQNVLIPLGNFLTGSFMAIVQTITSSIIALTQSAVIPLINTLSGAFTNVLHTVSDLLNGLISNALNGVKGIVEAVGRGFESMGSAIRNVLEGVQGVLQVFADMITNMSSAVVALVSLATGRSVNYGYGYAHLFAEGGRVFGPGSTTSDSIPARLSKDEYVIKASAAQKIGYDQLDQLNRTGQIGGGGQVNYFTINGYNKSPEELATIISRKIAFKTRGVIG